ncbi:ABC transporter substrate-binding protein [Streptomyces sp. NPDC090088]|uniref:ABC transporter substrate-binding protein n=1 Tax=Streptomyces sp. NPDC090088 TaxID=3365944 RepID=UPI003813E09E
MPSSSATGSPIKVGYVLGETGILASYDAGKADTAKAWASAVNAAGGLNGHPVDLIIEDTKSVASSAISVARDLVETKKVAAVIVSDQVSEGTIADYLASKHIAVLQGGGSDEAVWSSRPNFYEVTAPIAITNSGAVGAVVADGAKKLGAVTCSDVSSCATASHVIEQQASALKVGFAASLRVANTATNFTPQCLSVAQKKVDGLVVALAPATAVQLALACRQQGYNGAYSLTGGAFSSQSLSDVTGAHFTASLQGFPWWDKSPATKQFREAIAKYAPKLKIGTSGPTAVWTSLALFQKVVSGINGEVTRASIIDGYSAVKNESLGGLLAQPVTFTADKPSPRVVCYWPVKYQAGDDAPATLHPAGRVGNGAKGDLASSCIASPPPMAR